jgi:putative SbcD/Mre11-related phosphoesterase
MEKGLKLPKLAENIIATEDGLGVYLPKIDALVIADLHLGIELSLFDEGTYIPIDQYEIMHKTIENLNNKYNPTLIIINGDFKHEFARASHQEWHELKGLIQSLTQLGVRLEIVRGNHDNYLKTVLSRQGKTLREPYFITSDYLFMHGHQSLQEVFKSTIPDVKWIVLAHEHPAIELQDDTGGKHKFKCYLKGRWEEYHILVLPAFSPFASGTVVNKIDQSQILSPVLKEMKLEEFRPLVMDNGELLTFPTIGELDKHID